MKLPETEKKLLRNSITKCPECGKTYDDEYDRMTDANPWMKRTKHLSLVNSHTFQDSLGTQYAWTIEVSCKCGNKYTFGDST